MKLLTKTARAIVAGILATAALAQAPPSFAPPDLDRLVSRIYESYIHPITILSTLPSAGVGALLALLLSHTDLSVIAMIGIILLIGLVKKNAILMIDFALAAERLEGKSSRDSIFEAAILRFRPAKTGAFHAGRKPGA